MEVNHTRPPVTATDRSGTARRACQRWLPSLVLQRVQDRRGRRAEVEHGLPDVDRVAVGRHDAVDRRHGGRPPVGPVASASCRASRRCGVDPAARDHERSEVRRPGAPTAGCRWQAERTGPVVVRDDDGGARRGDVVDRVAPAGSSCCQTRWPSLSRYAATRSWLHATSGAEDQVVLEGLSRVGRRPRPRPRRASRPARRRAAAGAVDDHQVSRSRRPAAARSRVGICQRLARWPGRTPSACSARAASVPRRRAACRRSAGRAAPGMENSSPTSRRWPGEIAASSGDQPRVAGVVARSAPSPRRSPRRW